MTITIGLGITVAAGGSASSTCILFWEQLE
jgi:hypothetical protein